MPDEKKLKQVKHVVHHKPWHLKWDNQGIKGLTYLVTDRGSLWWKDRVGKVASMTCRCRVAQNATYTCLSLAERKGRTMEKLEVEGPEGCRAVADFL